MKWCLGTLAAGLLAVVLAAVPAAAKPSLSGQHQTLAKLAEAANRRLAEGTAGKGVVAARPVVGGAGRAQLVEKLRLAAGRQAQSLAVQSKARGAGASERWLAKLQQQSQAPRAAKIGHPAAAPKAAAVLQADEDLGGAPGLVQDAPAQVGQLVPLGDTDTYRFEGVEGQVVDLALDSEEFDAYLELEYGGVVIAVDDDGGEGTNARLEDQVLPASGTYTVRVHAYGDGETGAYALALSTGGSPVEDLGVLAPGTAGYTLPEGGVSHLFHVAVAQKVQLQLAVASDEFDAFISVYAGSEAHQRSEASLVGWDDDSGGGTNPLLQVLVDSGSYLVEVRGFSSNQAGAYTLELQALTVGDDEDAAAARALAFGLPETGGLFPFGDTDRFVFSGEAGEVVDLGLDSEDFDAYLELRLGDEAIAVDDDGGEGYNALIDGFVLPVTGEYLAVVHAYGDEGEGSYALSLVRQEVPWTLVGDLEAGAMAGNLAMAGEIHLYSVHLTEMNQVQVDLASDVFDAYLTLYVGQGLADLSPENQLAADDDGGGGLDSRLALALEPGDYLLEVRSFSSSASGAYTLSLDLSGLGADEDEASAVPLALGEPVAGALVPVGDTDAYSFSGLAGEVVDLSLESADFDAFVEVAFAGETIALDDDGGEGLNSLVQGLVLPFTGSYRVVVRALGDGGFGAYQVSLTDATPPLSTNSTLEAGAHSGKISEAGQLQLYPLVLASTVELVVELRAEQFDAYLSLYRGSGPADRSAGNLLAADDDGGEGVDARLDLLLPAGQYLIEARPLVSGTLGDYTLELSTSLVADDEDQDSLPVLVAAQDRTGRLSPAGDVDAYTLVGTAGQVVDLGLASADFDPFLELWGDGELLASDDDGGEDLDSRIAGFALPVDGTYQVRVRAYADEAAGAYTLALASTAGLVTLNPSIEPGSFTGQVGAEGQVQLYPLHLAERTQVQVGLSASRYAAGLVLYQGSDLSHRNAANLVAAARALGAGETAQLIQELPAGDYLLEAGAGQEAQTGTFALVYKVAVPDRAHDRVTLVGGTLNQTRITPFAASLAVAPGAKISGTLDLAVENTHARSEVFQLVQVQTWGEVQSGFRELDDRVLPGSTRHTAAVDLTAPTQPGTYHLIIAAAAEPGAAEIASGTHWESADAPRWGDTDDLAAWDTQRLAQATGQGWVEVEWYQHHRVEIGAFALEVVVAAPTQVDAGPITLDFDTAAGDQGNRAVNGVVSGQVVQVQMHVAAAPRISGWGVQLQYDPDHVRYVGSSFAPGAFVPGLVPLVAETAGQVEVGGAVLGTGATGSGDGMLGSLSFEVLPGFSASTTLSATQVSFRTVSEGRIKEAIRAVGTLSGATQAQTGPMAIDFDLAAGDQEDRQQDGVRSGDVVRLQLTVAGAPPLRGWSARLEYDPTQLRYLSGSFAPSLFVPGLVPLVGEKAGRVDVGGTLLGSGSASGGDGVLGTLAFEVLPAFAASAELAISRISFNTAATGEQAQVTRSVAVLSAQAALAADFDASGAVDFSDFFLFADHFGQSATDRGWDAQYDLSGNGEVDFSDFFLFADNFGREAQAKLLDLAQRLLGLPAGTRLEQNYPNPFNGATQIRYQVDRAAAVDLEIRNLEGQALRHLQRGVQEAGIYQVTWDGRDAQGRTVASGVYFCRLRAGDQVQVRRMLYLR